MDHTPFNAGLVYVVCAMLLVIPIMMCRNLMWHHETPNIVATVLVSALSGMAIVRVVQHWNDGE